MDVIRTVIADRESCERERVRKLIGSLVDFNIVAEFSDGADLVEAVPALRPHVVFMDVEMPTTQGIEAASTIRRSRDSAPEIVLMTQFPHRVVEAFDVGAMDCLLKPFAHDRFDRTIERLRLRVGRPTGFVPRVSRIAVKISGRVHVVELSRVDWIEAAGNYVRLHMGDLTHLHRESIGVFEQRLDDRRFVRIHRSTIVNIERIVTLDPSLGREYVVVLRDGTQLNLGTSYRHRLERVIAGI